MNNFLILRIPHQTPPTLHENVEDRQGNEYDSFWDDCHAIYSFSNVEEIKHFVKDTSKAALIHQYWNAHKLLINYLLDNDIKL